MTYDIENPATELGMKLVQKDYRSNSYYHIFNRGALQKNVFRSHQDFKCYFGSLLNILETSDNNIRCLAYALLPTHYHLVIWQRDARDISLFVRRLSSAYARFYCKKYHHIGHIFESRYKAVLITNPWQLQRAIDYVLCNPLSHRLSNWKWVGRLSSY
jgi:putative transposase